MLSQRKKNYMPLIPPIAKAAFDFSEEEAKEYFTWFVAHIDERAEYVAGKAARGLNIPIEKMDYGMASMKLLWQWFLRIAETEKRKNVRKFPFSENRKQAFAESIYQNAGSGLSVFTEYVLRDIGMYVGKSFTSRHQMIQWGYKTKPKRYAFVNTPLLMGFVDGSYTPPFHAEYDPIQLVRGLAMRMIEHRESPEDLFDFLMRWENMIPKEGAGAIEQND